jgi:hypothetical protein
MMGQTRAKENEMWDVFPVVASGAERGVSVADFVKPGVEADHASAKLHD